MVEARELESACEDAYCLAHKIKYGWEMAFIVSGHYWSGSNT